MLTTAAFKQSDNHRPTVLFLGPKRVLPLPHPLDISRCLYVVLYEQVMPFSLLVCARRDVWGLPTIRNLWSCIMVCNDGHLGTAGIGVCANMQWVWLIALPEFPLVKTDIVRNVPCCQLAYIWNKLTSSSLYKNKRNGLKWGPSLQPSFCPGSCWELGKQ